MTQSAGFDNLPEELIIRIFNELDVYDISSCSLTCRLFHAVIRDDLILQYKMSLTIAGVEDGDAESRLPVVDRLAQLKTIEQGWADLHFRKRYRLRYPSSPTWMVYGGILAQCLPFTGLRGMSFMELPSAEHESSGRVWQHHDLGVGINDFSMDPSQDLVVLVNVPAVIESASSAPFLRFQIHLRSMSTGGTHPRAADPVLLSELGIDQPIYTFIIRIMSDFLAIHFYTVVGAGEDRLYIWNWTTGQLVTDLKTSSYSGKMEGLSFLSPRHFIIGRYLYDTRYVYQPPALDVFDFLAPQLRGSTKPQLIRTYELPSAGENISVLTLIPRSDPYPGFSPPPTPRSKPFYAAPDSRLMSIGMDFISHSEYKWYYVLFVHQSLFLEDLEPKSRQEDRTIPWERWGPAKTRLMRTDANEYQKPLHVYGTRYIRLEPSPLTAVGFYLRVLDFNPLTLRRVPPSSAEPRSSPSEGSYEPMSSTSVLVSQPTVHSAPQSPFSETVCTSLPYRDVRSRETFNYSAVMIDQDCVVGYRNKRRDRRNKFIELLCV